MEKDLAPTIVDKPRTPFMEILGMNRALSISLVLLCGAAVAFAVYWGFHSAPLRVVTITSGPEGSVFQRNAEKYGKILKRDGVTLRILPSEGSLENLKRLADPSFRVDVGFVQTGESPGANIDRLVSLGSLYNEPLLVFYRGAKPVELLSQFEGKRVAIGPDGSGTQALALTLLAANGIKPGGPTKLRELDSDDAAIALLDGKIEAAFLMGDSASSKVLREFLHRPDIHLVNFTQADAYTRRIPYLNKLELPKGSVDFGKDIPTQDVSLLGPTVELIGRSGLHPALSDLLLEAAREVHSGPGIFRRRGEFPTPQEHDIRLSKDAVRFYKSGKSFFYRALPFSMASLVDRIVVVFLPLLLVLIPGVKFVLSAYRWRMNLVVNRWYRALLTIERELLVGATPDHRRQLIGRLDHIEKTVNKTKVPAFFAGQFYELRGHIGFVRGQMMKVESDPS